LIFYSGLLNFSILFCK
jgi:hypothetical protein